MKKYYIKGNILINTPYFYCKNAGAYYEYQDGMEILETNVDDPQYGPCLLIDDEHPQSIFGEYYAQGGLCSYCGSLPLYSNTYQDNFDFFMSNVNNAEMLLQCELDERITSSINNQVYMMIVSALDTFVADTLLTTILSDQKAFEQYVISKLVDPQKKSKLMEIYVEKGIGAFETETIQYVMKRSYSSEDTIEKVFSLPMINICKQLTEVLRPMKNIFQHRHLIAHRNGRMLDGNHLSIPDIEVSTAADGCKSLVSKIHKLLQTM